ARTLAGRGTYPQEGCSSSAQLAHDHTIKCAVAEPLTNRDQGPSELACDIASLRPLGANSLGHDARNHARICPGSLPVRLPGRFRNCLGYIAIRSARGALKQTIGGHVTESCLDDARLDHDDTDTELGELESQTIRPTFECMLGR